MVFRKDSKVDAFQRQISALRHQLGGDSDDVATIERDRLPALLGDRYFRSDLPDLDLIRSETVAAYADAPENFAPAAAEPLASRLPAVPAVDTLTSVIAHTTAWNGTLESSGSLHVHGRVDGSLIARNDIFIGEEAEIDAIVSAASVTVAGNVRGSIRCSDRFEILPRGRVIGDVHAPIIVIHDGAMIAGEIAMSAATEPRLAATSPETRAARGGD